MKKIIGNILTLIFATILFSCDDNTFDMDYSAPLQITFEGVDNSNIVTVDKGVLSYNAKIRVTAPEVGIKYFEIYKADNKTGAKENVIQGTSQILEDADGNGVPSFELTYTIDDLTENKCIKVVVTDGNGNPFEKNLFVKITPSVFFTTPVKIETVEDYYGPYFASWYDGRVYMRAEAAKYRNEIDFSLGDVVIESISADTIPALVNPARRSDFKLLTTDGLQQTRFSLTDLTPADFNAINQIDATPITSLNDPTEDAVMLIANKVYLFKSANGKKGLIHVSALGAKSGTIESVTGEWNPDTDYHQATISTKVVHE